MSSSTVEYQIATGVPINVKKCCSGNVVQQIENNLSERAVQSQCIIRYQDSIPILKAAVIIENQLSERAVWTQCIISCQGSIAIAVPTNEDIRCSCTIVYQSEKRLSKHAVPSQCIIRCQDSIDIAVPVNEDICHSCT